MKPLKLDNINKNIKACLSLNKEQKNLFFLYSKQINDEQYLLNINIKKEYFISKNEKNQNINNDILFVLHITHNFPTNPPRLFCLTSLSYLGIEICDGKDILEEVLCKKWENQVTLKEIILELPKFMKRILKYKNNKLIFGKFILEYEYEYNMLTKIPHHYFNFVDEVINKKTKMTEKRLIMITNLFFLVFEYKEGYFSYKDIKLLFWASIMSIYGMQKNENCFEFEFSKTLEQRIFLSLITKDGENIMELVLFILKNKGINYIANNKNKMNNKEKNKLPGSDGINENNNKILEK